MTLFFLILFIWLLSWPVRVIKKRYPAGKQRNKGLALYLAMVAAVLFGQDGIRYVELRSMCAKEGGVHVYKAEKIDSLDVEATEPKYIPGFAAVDSLAVDTGVATVYQRCTSDNPDDCVKEDAPLSPYVLKGDYLGLPEGNGEEIKSVVKDLRTNEILAEFVQVRVRRGWFLDSLSWGTARMECPSDADHSQLFTKILKQKNELN